MALRSNQDCRVEAKKALTWLIRSYTGSLKLVKLVATAGPPLAAGGGDAAELAALPCRHPALYTGATTRLARLAREAWRT